MNSSSSTQFRSPEHILRPRSAVIVGASERAKYPVTISANLRKSGYGGNLYLINPKYTEISGSKCYPNFSSLPEVPDHAMIIVPAEFAVQALADAAAAGVKAATVFSNNIGDGGFPESQTRAAVLKEICERTGIKVSGPNCLGSNSLHERYFIYPNPELCKAEPGNVSGVFQSGGMLQFWCKAAAERGIKFNYVVSSGNELNLDLADYVNFFVEDVRSKVIVLFIEGIRRTDAFIAAAGKALAARKPIIAMKTGKSEESREAAKSHTGAIAGDYQAFKAMCERYGIIHCSTLDEMVETALAFQELPLPRGSRVGFVTTSGGTVDLLHDYVHDIGGISMPDFTAETKERIQPHVPPEVNIRNPLDGGIPTNDATAALICKAVSDDPNIDMVAWAGPIGKGPARNPAALRGMKESTDKPIISFGRMYYQLDSDNTSFQGSLGFPLLLGLPQTVKALGALAAFAAKAGQVVAPLPAPKGDRRELSGDALYSLLGSHGLASPKSTIVANAQEAAQAASKIGFPVAIKIISADILHKTEFRAVRINLKDEAEVERASQRLIEVVSKAAPQTKIDGVLVQEMVTGEEVILGVRTDPQYGPMMVVGAGGIMVELIEDVAVRLLPVDRDTAQTMISETKVGKLLAGFRGRPACDVDALINAMCGLSTLYLDYRHVLADLEINPLIVRRAGEGVGAVDIRPIFI